MANYGKEVKSKVAELTSALYKTNAVSVNLFDHQPNLCRLVKLAREHNALQVHNCNGTMTPRMESRERNIERDIQAIASQVLGLRVTFSGDPRGYTVKLHADPECNFYNTWGGLEEGYGIG